MNRWIAAAMLLAACGTASADDVGPINVTTRTADGYVAVSLSSEAETYPGLPGKGIPSQTVRSYETVAEYGGYGNGEGLEYFIRAGAHKTTIGEAFRFDPPENFEPKPGFLAGARFRAALSPPDPPGSEFDSVRRGAKPFRYGVTGALTVYSSVKQTKDVLVGGEPEKVEIKLGPRIVARISAIAQRRLADYPSGTLDAHGALSIVVGYAKEHVRTKTAADESIVTGELLRNFAIPVPTLGFTWVWAHGKDESENRGRTVYTPSISAEIRYDRAIAGTVTTRVAF